MKRTAIHRAIAEETHGDLPAVAQLRAQGGAGREGNSGAHDSVRAHEPVIRRVHMHAAAAPAGAACDFSVELGHHLTARNAFRQRVPVTAMRAVGHVRRTKMRADSSSHSFFTDIKMHEAGQFAGAVKRLHFALELAQL